jgi:hypothetical protein
VTTGGSQTLPNQPVSGLAASEARLNNSPGGIGSNSSGGRGSQSALLTVRSEKKAGRWPKGKDFLFATWAFVIGEYRVLFEDSFRLKKVFTHFKLFLCYAFFSKKIHTTQYFNRVSKKSI